MKKIMIILLSCSALVFGSCTKKGPQGPQGPQGNANVKGSDPFTVSTWSFNNDENAYMASFTDPDVTSAVAARGSVEIFLKYNDGTWRALPDIVNGTQFFSRFSTGGFDIYFAKVDGTAPNFPGTWTFRSVIIAPSFKQSHPGTDLKNYNELMAVMNAEQSRANTNITQ